MKYLKIFVIIAAVFCASCSALSFNPYRQADVNSAHATVSGTMKTTSRHEVYVVVEKIDGLGVGYAKYDKKIRLSPGSHFISAHVMSKKLPKSFLKVGDWAKVSPIRFTAKPGVDYRIMAQVTDDVATAYIVDSKGRMVSRKVKGDFIPAGTYKVEVYEMER